MPAIQPSRLKIKAAELAQFDVDPDEFCRAFRSFLDLYADRTFRAGQVGKPRPLLRAYHVPAPVLPAVEKEINQFSIESREPALELADTLWMEQVLEFRLLAVSIVGQVSPKPFQAIITRVESWVNATSEERLIKAIVYFGLVRFLQEYPGTYLEQIEIWLSSETKRINRLGLSALPPLLESGKFGDYPQLFNQIGKLIRGELTPLKTEILEIIEVLAHQAPEETAYFLGQTKISTVDNAQISWYIRKSLDYFPMDSQRYLRDVLLEA
jgi:hypothetical protein